MFQSFLSSIESSFARDILPLVVDYYRKTHGIESSVEDLITHLKISNTQPSLPSPRYTLPGALPSSLPSIAAPAPMPKSKAKKAPTQAQVNKEETDKDKLEQDNIAYAQGYCVYLRRNKFCGEPIESGRLFCNTCRSVSFKTVRDKFKKSIKPALDANGGRIDMSNIGAKKPSSSSASSGKSSVPSNIIPQNTVTTGDIAAKYKNVRPTISTVTGAVPSIITSAQDFRWRADKNAYINTAMHSVADKRNGEYIIIGTYNIANDEIEPLNTETIKTARSHGYRIDDGQSYSVDDDNIDESIDYDDDNIDESIDYDDDNIDEY